MKRTENAILLTTLLIIAAWMTACAPQLEAPPRESRTLPPPTLPDACRPSVDRSGEQLFSFDTTLSKIHILAYRSGRLARLGHNHIISAEELRGYLHVTERFEDSHFVLCVPVLALVVDDPVLRAAAGDAFTTHLDASAREGTRRNMLSEKLLSATLFPFIIARGEITTGTSKRQPLRLTITMLANDTVITTESETTITAQQVRATGELTLRQSELGLTPYSALFGALSVRDELEIRYSLVAVR